jgi:hypothetical protein
MRRSARRGCLKGCGSAAVIRSWISICSCRSVATDTLRSAAFDLKTLFTVVGKDPAAEPVVENLVAHHAAPDWVHVPLLRLGIVCFSS